MLIINITHMLCIHLIKFFHFCQQDLTKMPNFSPSSIFIFCMLFSISFADGSGFHLIVVNNCEETIWPAILATAGQTTPSNGGFQLAASEATAIEVPEGWSGRVWGRQGCSFDENGKGSCLTGDCAGLMQCKGLGGQAPATIVQMTLGTSKSAAHYYDVSLVDGFNLPVSMSPVGDYERCGVAACETNLNMFCPPALAWKKNGKMVGCKSACLAAKTDRYCCTGDFASPEKCKPSVYTRLFKAFCPHAYSYAYDESTGLKTCRATQYLITFCPPKYE